MNTLTGVIDNDFRIYWLYPGARSLYRIGATKSLRKRFLVWWLAHDPGCHCNPRIRQYVPRPDVVGSGLALFQLVT